MSIEKLFESVYPKDTAHSVRQLPVQGTKRRMTRVHVLVGGIVFVSVVLTLFLLRPREQIVVLEEGAIHGCYFEKLSYTISPGQKVNIPFALQASGLAEDTTLTLGALPHGVSGNIDDAATVTDRKVLQLDLSRGTQKGSFSIVITHKEVREGHEEDSICQVNVIIE